MNNIYQNTPDPILQNMSSYGPYRDSLPFVAPPQIPQPFSSQKDYINLLDEKLAELSDYERDTLFKNGDFVLLNNSFNSILQREILLLVKNKLNNDPSAIDNINKQLQTINKVRGELKERERQNMDIFNDYISNYPNISFVEYQNIKSSPQKQEIETEDRPKKLFSK